MKSTRTFSMMMAVLALAGTAGAGAQEITLSGQLRPRMEGRSTRSRSDEFATMRTRAALHATPSPAVSVLLELQDVRLWGGELNTTANPDRIELHQGYLDLGTAGLAARIGRQEATYGEERLVGASDWTQQARAFDGARGRVGRGNISIDGFAYQIADALDASQDVNERFIGTYATLRATAVGAVEGYALHNRTGGTVETRQTTLGARLSDAGTVVGYRVEAAIQRGTRAGLDAHAFMGTARVTANGLNGAGQVTLWYDYLSGDDDPADADARVFDTLYGTNHKFYGMADIFTNIPLHTGNRGLQDIALKSGYNVSSAVTVNGELHQFRAAAAKGLASADFGREADLAATYRYSPKLAVNGGASYYARGDGLDAIRRAVPNQLFTYIMLNATF
jgi:hypothetical protein